MKEPDSGGFGSKLREARERRGITLREIANTTKISMSVLEALERNDISRLPGGIFSRAFVRSYAVVVGLEPEPLIREFMAQFPHDSVTAGHPISSPVDDSVAIEGDRRTATAFLRMILISVPIVGVLIYFGTVGRSVPPANPVPPAARPIGAPATALPIASPEPTAPPQAPSSTTAAVERLAVVIAATAPCWVSAVVDGKPAFERQLDAGERRVFDVARELVLKVGDPNALVVTLNGGKARRLGRFGELVTIRLTPANYREYLSAP